MNDWQSTWLGRRYLPRDLSDFEIEALITFTGNEQRVIEERRRLALRLALALQIGFLGRSGRLLEAVLPHEHARSALDVTCCLRLGSTIRARRFC